MFFFEGMNGFIHKIVFPFIKIIKHPDDVEQCGFARTRGADNGNTAAALNAQAYVREYLQWRFRGGDDFVKVAGNYDSV